MKKIILFTLCLFVSIGLWAQSGTCGKNLTWTIVDDVLIISGTGAMDDYDLNYDLLVPNSPWVSYTFSHAIINEGVTSIGRSAFSNCSGLTSITIPNSVMSIGDYAFAACSGLPVIDNIQYADCVAVSAIDRNQSAYVIKEGTRFIHSGAFAYRSALTSITIPNSVTSIGNFAFRECSGLTSITIPNSVTSIGDDAFRECSGLTSVTIPNSVTSIGDFAFSGCSGLTSITIPNSVTSIGNRAFSSCSALTNVTIPSSVDNMDNTAFSSCPIEVLKIDNTKYCSSEYFGKKLKEVEIGNSVARIKAATFYDCKSLSNLIIGESVAEIESSAFKHTNLTTIYSFAVHPPKILDHPFDYETYTQATLYVPTGAAFTRYYSAQYWRNFKNMEEFNTTEVNTINIKELPAECNYYNLQGQHSTDASRGISIVNGKKMLTH